MSALLESLLIEKERIIPLIGLNGIGKSALARNTLHYVAERKIFSGGVLFIQCKNIRDNYSIVSKLMNTIIRFLDPSEE